MPLLCIFSLLILSMNLLALFKAASYAWMISLAFIKGRWTEAQIWMVSSVLNLSFFGVMIEKGLICLRGKP